MFISNMLFWLSYLFIFVSNKNNPKTIPVNSWFKFNANNYEILPTSVFMQMSKLQGAQIQMFKHIYIEHSHAPVHVQMHIQTRWLEGGLWLWQASLSASRSPRLWERMGRNAKETRRSQAYSSKVEVGGWGGRWRLEVKEKGDWMLFPMLILPVCRDHMCVNQALEHPFCLFCLFWSVSLRSLSPSFSLFFSIVLIFKCFYYFVALITSCFCV